ncbi:hypothetical protein [Hymenobacter nivis]|uniref:Uncharacterized protein n=1 Tax=Hymenobacter nivis TaxID=1850093 RepID=A0A502GZ31_9BACT|nr:hypothetical protein [Hymenobacter nivis]TPG66420.1 hypothetical protein EAH73_08375 [Hymenobacter nivis]
MPNPAADPAKPPESKRGLWVPLLLNAALLLLLGALVRSLAEPDHMTGDPHPRDVAYGMFLAMLGLGGFDLLALFVAALLRRPRWVNGFALAGLLVFLIGLGSCAYML